MKKIIVSSLLILSVLLAGCGGNAATESAETSSGVSSDAASASDGAPAGVEANAAATSAVSGNNIAQASSSQEEGIVLRDPEYKKLADMITFSGEFVGLAEIGADISEINVADISVSSIELVGADNEMLYYIGGSDTSSLMQFSALTRVTESVWDKDMSDITVCYADKDYIVYSKAPASDGGYRTEASCRIFFREDKTEADMPLVYVGQPICRTGKSLFFNYTDRVREKETDNDHNVSIVYRYVPRLDYTSVVCSGGVIYGASDYGACLGVNGSIYYADPVTDPNVSGEYPFSAAAMDMAGEYPTYTILWNSDALGDKYEVGYYPHYLVRKVLLRTQYNTDVYFTAVTKNKAAVTLLGAKGMNGECAAVIDAVNMKAALLDGMDEYNAVISSGSFVYIITCPGTVHSVSDERLITIDTSKMGQ